jgi:phosphatidylglycerophosphate synthase
MHKDLKKIKSLQKRPDGFFGSFMTRPFSPYLSLAAYRLNLSPNTVSILSFLFCFAGAGILLLSNSYVVLILAAIFWWIGAILDSSDGDLARFLGKNNMFGGWLDSFLDRLKEFMIFTIMGFLAWKHYHNDIFLLLGLLSIFSTVMSGYITDSKKLFIKEKRKPEIVLGSKYIMGMVDTRDFFVILSLLVKDFRLALLTYGTVFILVDVAQLIFFVRKYERK